MQLRQTKNYIKKVYINKLAKAVLRQKKQKLKGKTVFIPRMNSNRLTLNFPLILKDFNFRLESKLVPQGMLAIRHQKRC